MKKSPELQARDAKRWFATAFKRLEAAGWDAPEHRFAAVVPVAAVPKAEYRRALIEIDRGLERALTRADGWEAKGRIQLALGEFTNAAVSFDESLRLEPGRPGALRGRAECRLLQSQPAAALADAQASGDAYWIGLCLLTLRRFPEAVAALEAADQPIALAVRALARWRAGERSAAVADLDRAAARAPWVNSLRALLLAEAGDPGAIAAMESAGALLPWMYVKLSEWKESFGRMRDAVADMDRAVEQEPQDAVLRGRRAFLNGCVRSYRHALKDYSEAMRLSPKDPEWPRRRMELNLVLGELKDALADAERALKLLPGDADLTAKRAQILILSGRYEAAKGGFWKGYAELRRGRPAKAAAYFGKEKGTRAGFYSVLSRALAAGLDKSGAEKARGGKLLLCGLGLFPPYTASLEVIGAIRASDVAFNNTSGPEAAELLWALCPRVRPATYDAREDEKEWADRLFAELYKGKTVAFVTRGHAQVFGGLAWELVARCRAEKIPCAAFGAVSSLNHVPAAAAAAGVPVQALDALQLLDLSAVAEGAVWDRTAPALFTFYHGPDQQTFPALCRRLVKEYGADHPVLLFGPRYEAAPRRVSAGSLSGRTGELHPSVMALVPPGLDTTSGTLSESKETGVRRGK